MYGGNKAKGICFILIVGSLLAIITIGITQFLSSDNAGISRIFGLAAVIAAVLFLTFNIYVLFDAYKTTKYYNATHQLRLEPVFKKKTWLAVFLSSIFPGLGQCYNEQIFKGVSFLICAILLHFIHPAIDFFLLFSLKLFSIKDAFDSAEKKNGSNRKFFEQGTHWVKIFVIAMVLIDSVPFEDLIKTYFVQADKISSSSMSPALEIGDHILVDKRSEARASIKREEIVVFIYPTDRSKDFIKRVIGLSSDSIEIRNKKIFLNGLPYNDIHGVYTEDFITPGPYQTRDNLALLTVPAGSLFVIGDNRDRSLDSRFFGCVPQEDVKGRALKIYWSWDSKNKRVRWERIGMRIK